MPCVDEEVHQVEFFRNMSLLPVFPLKRIVRNIGNDMVDEEFGKPVVTTSKEDNINSAPKKRINRIILDTKFVQMLNICCSEFLDMIASESCEICEKRDKYHKRKLVSENHVILALDELGLTEYKEYVIKQFKQLSDKNSGKSGSSKNTYRKPCRGTKRKANATGGDDGVVDTVVPVSKLILRKKARARARKKKHFFKQKLSKEEEALLAAEQEKLFQRTTETV
jgi:histone H3/H4